jgi:hypothetical protein
MWKRTLLYGAVLAAGTLALQWLDYQRLARVHSGDIPVGVLVSLVSAGLLRNSRFLPARG